MYGRSDLEEEGTLLVPKYLDNKIGSEHDPLTLSPNFWSLDQVAEGNRLFFQSSSLSPSLNRFHLVVQLSLKPCFQFQRTKSETSLNVTTKSTYFVSKDLSRRVTCPWKDSLVNGNRSNHRRFFVPSVENQFKTHTSHVPLIRKVQTFLRYFSLNSQTKGVDPVPVVSVGCVYSFDVVSFRLPGSVPVCHTSTFPTLILSPEDYESAPSVSTQVTKDESLQRSDATCVWRK